MNEIVVSSMNTNEMIAIAAFCLMMCVFFICAFRYMAKTKPTESFSSKMLRETPVRPSYPWPNPVMPTTSSKQSNSNKRSDK